MLQKHCSLSSAALEAAVLIVNHWRSTTTEKAHNHYSCISFIHFPPCPRTHVNAHTPAHWDSSISVKKLTHDYLFLVCTILEPQIMIDEWCRIWICIIVLLNWLRNRFCSWLTLCQIPDVCVLIVIVSINELIFIIAPEKASTSNHSFHFI